MAEIVLGVTGSIAAFKAADLCSKLVQSGHGVSVVLTDSAARLVAPATFEYLSGRPVHRALFGAEGEGDISHITLTDKADAVVLAPLTANTIARLASGLADDLLTTLMLAVRSPVLLCPAMNPRMWSHPAVRENIARLQSFGWHLLEPEAGHMACGHVGAGRLVEPPIIQRSLDALLAGESRLPRFRRVLETCSPLDTPPTAALRGEESAWLNRERLRGALETRACTSADGVERRIWRAADIEEARTLAAGSPIAREHTRSSTFELLEAAEVPRSDPSPGS